jgi:glycosyltransferase involved in cell wall biosynthesis
MNVLHIITGDLWAGAEAQAFAMLEGFQKSDAIALYVVTFNDGRLYSELKATGVYVELIEERKNHAMALVLKLRSILEKWKIEIVHAHGYKESFLGGLAARSIGVKAVVRTHHGRGVLAGNFKHTWIEWVNRVFLTDYSIAVSHELKQYLKTYHYKEPKIKVIHNAINPVNVKPHRRPEHVKSALGLSMTSLIIGSMGRMVSVKGYDVFIKGALAVANKIPNAMFILAGDGPLKNELQSMAQKLGIEKRFRFLGFRKDAYDVLSTFDIFVLTSLHEGVPMVLLEAMALNKPIVSTMVGGIPEIISDHENGLLIPCMCPDSLAEACISLCKDKALRTRLGANARKAIINNHNLDLLTEKVFSLYRVAIV